MSRVRRLLGAALFLALGSLISAAPALAAQRVEVVDVPSLQGNIDLKAAKVNRITSLQARVMLPDGYDEQPDRRWPVLYLLHGVGDTSATWLDPRFGDATVRAKGLPAIVVMPEGGRGYYTDAWLGGTRAGVNWERYTLDEVVPAMEARYRIAPGRANHTIAGLSMGAYGAVLLGAQLPSYFGTVVSYSGLYNIEAAEAQAYVPFFSHFSYTRQWGRYHSPYVQAHNPIRLLDNLQASRIFVSAGNGTWQPDVPFNVAASFSGGLTEWLAQIDAQHFVNRARGQGIGITFRSHTVGLHYWWYWRRELQTSIGWGLFGEPPAPAVDTERTHFSYRTMAPHGNAWGLGFRFAALPTDQLVLHRDGQHLTATGKGTITITPGAADADASGNGTRTDCAFTATLPFERELPDGC